MSGPYNYLLNFASQYPSGGQQQYVTERFPSDSGPAINTRPSYYQGNTQNTVSLSYPTDTPPSINPPNFNSPYNQPYSGYGFNAGYGQLAFLLQSLLQQFSGQQAGYPSQATTMKYPSDSEDGGSNPGGPGLLTRKAPSDAEDGGFKPYPGPVATTGPDLIGSSYKFPSDNEDGGIKPFPGPVAITAPDLIGATNKFPSDNEDGGTKPPTLPIATTAPDLINMTMKYPSDNEDGGAGQYV